MAEVACRQMGLPTPGRVLPGGSFGPGTGPVIICEPLLPSLALHGAAAVPATARSSTSYPCLLAICRPLALLLHADKLLGLPSAPAVMRPFAARAQDCTGNEARLQDCPSNPWGSIVWGVRNEPDRQFPSAAIQCDTENAKSEFGSHSGSCRAESQSNPDVCACHRVADYVWLDERNLAAEQAERAHPAHPPCPFVI